MPRHRIRHYFPLLSCSLGLPRRATGGFVVWVALCTLITPVALAEGESGGGLDEDGPRLAATVIEEDVHGRDLSPLERRQALRRARAEVKWWHEIEAPSDAEERYAYMVRMLHSLHFFLQHELGHHLHTAIEEQRALREDDVAFAVLAGLVGGYGPTLEARGQALNDVRRALRLDPRFAFARFADGLVRILREQARVMRGQGLQVAQVRIAVTNLERAIEARPRLAEAHRFLALGQIMLAEPAKALSAADEALALAPERTAIWRVCVAVLRNHKPRQLIQEIERRLREHEDAVPPAMRLHIFGMLADEHTRSERYNEAFELLTQRALPVAHEHPEELTAAQWRGLYAEAATAAAHKQPRDITIAFAFLEAAKLHSESQRLRLYPLLAPMQAVLTVLLAETEPSEEQIREHAGDYLRLLCEVLANDALTEQETRRVVEGLQWLLGVSPLGPAELEVSRQPLWGLTRWLFVQHARTNDSDYFDLGMSCLLSLLPVEPEREYRRYAEDKLTAASAVDLREVQVTLIEHGITAAHRDIREASAHLLARLLRSTDGAERQRFLRRARRLLEPERLNENAVLQMEAVCEVLRLYPVETLAPVVLEGMQRVQEAEEPAYCQRLFPTAHAALNAMTPESVEPEWQPGANTPLEEYARLLETWRERDVVAGR